MGYEESIEWDQESIILLTHSLLVLSVVLHILGGVDFNDREDGVEQKEVRKTRSEIIECPSS